MGWPVSSDKWKALLVTALQSHSQLCDSLIYVTGWAKSYNQ